jgi:hypothetical protein
MVMQNPKLIHKIVLKNSASLASVCGQAHDFANKSVVKFYLIFLNNFWMESYNIRKPLRNDQVKYLFYLLRKMKTVEIKNFGDLAACNGFLAGP